MHAHAHAPVHTYTNIFECVCTCIRLQAFAFSGCHSFWNRFYETTGTFAGVLLPIYRLARIPWHIALQLVPLHRARYVDAKISAIKSSSIRTPTRIYAQTNTRTQHHLCFGDVLFVTCLPWDNNVRVNRLKVS